MRNTKEKHGMRYTKIYKIWAGIISRTTAKGDTNYKRYGAKGIKACARWKLFTNFYADMGSTYKPGLEIDRIDNSKGYEPKNCRWVTRKAQANNKTTNHLITFDGKTMNMKQWSESVGLTYSAFKNRINRYGWDISRALTQPIRGV